MDGATVEADVVVIATPAPEAARLTGLPMPQGHVSTACLYYAGDVALWPGKKLLLNANPNAFVNNATLLTNVAPEYAPPGQHLLSATLLGDYADRDDDTLLEQGKADLRRMLAGDRTALALLERYRGVAVRRVPYAQFAQPPGIHPQLPDNATDVPGLWLAAEFTEASSLNAAMISGEKAARQIGKAEI
jgi:protoporphyrinogen oxidase